MPSVSAAIPTDPDTRLLAYSRAATRLYTIEYRIDYFWKEMNGTACIINVNWCLSNLHPHFNFGSRVLGDDDTDIYQGDWELNDEFSKFAQYMLNEISCTVKWNGITRHIRNIYTNDVKIFKNVYFHVHSNNLITIEVIIALLRGYKCVRERNE